MGLDTTHNCWNGSYGSFNRFRYSLAAQIGVNLDEYIGYGDNGFKNLTSINHDLMPLFDHSDCDGDLSVEDCKRIANGLNSVLENFNDKIEVDGDFKEKMIQFRDGCLDAFSKNEKVLFG
ncbi:hypothetical protein [uncultured Acinetobacter sp.]|jgi:hypothetical protein|uniref:hypothetical protein n=1 Tax=uncultured Acinetobacter sp. TaxID=165433 RepID=UPI00261673D5|nr:hypothetical protein [uncultured Acinetobacter sp.]